MDIIKYLYFVLYLVSLWFVFPTYNNFFFYIVKLIIFLFGTIIIGIIYYMAYIESKILWMKLRYMKTKKGDEFKHNIRQQGYSNSYISNILILLYNLMINRGFIKYRIIYFIKDNIMLVSSISFVSIVFLIGIFFFI